MAAKVLGEIGGDEVVEPLVSALHLTARGYEAMRLAAQETLVELYRSGRLGEGDRQPVLARRNYLAEWHVNVTSS